MIPDDIPETSTEAPLGYRCKPKSPEWAADALRTVLFEARQLAVQHRDELLDQGFGRDDANHVASGALYDIQSAMLAGIWS